MTRSRLLIASAVLEVGAGLAFAIVPLTATLLLFGSAPEPPIGVIIGRLAGVALFSLGLACWLARDDDRGRAARGLVAAMLAYNAGAVALLTYAAVGLELGGVGLWPVALLHLAMAGWCLARLRPPDGSG